MNRKKRCSIVIAGSLLFLSALAQSSRAGTTYTTASFAQGMTHLRSGTVVFRGATVTGYTQGTSTTSWITLSGDTTVWQTDDTDDASQLVPIGFPFQFYGNVYGEVTISSNGFLTFGTAGATDATNDAIPNGANTPHNFIAPFWDNLIVASAQGTGDRVSYQTIGTAPARQFVVQYWSMSVVGDSSTELTAQVILNEGTNAIEILYHSTMQTWGGNVSASIGLENATGGAGVSVTGTPNIQAVPAANLLFTPTVTTATADDVGSAALPMGFSFNFFGTAYTNIYTSSNGYVSFTNADLTDFSNDNIPSGTLPNLYIAPFWDDLFAGPGGVPSLIWYATSGTAPNRVFTVEFYCLHSFADQTNARFTGQVVLYETSNRIELHYPTASGLNQWGTGATATVGIENATGASGYAVAGTPNIASVPASNFRWDPQSPNFTPVASAVGAVGAPVTVGTQQPFSVSRSIQNTGTAAGAVTYAIYLSTNNFISAADILVYTGTSGSIAAGATDTQTDVCTAPAAVGGPYYVGLFIVAGNTAVSAATEVTVTDVFTAQSIAVVGTAPVSVVQGGTFQATRTIANTGATAATTPYDIYLSTDATITAADTLVFSGTTASIAASGTDTQTDTCTVPAGLAAGNYYLGLFISATSNVATTTQEVTVTNRFTLVSVGAVGAPVWVAGGGTFQVTRTITNNDATAQNVTYDIRLSANATISAADFLAYNATDTIAAGATDTQTVTVTAPPGGGPYYVGLYETAQNWISSANQEVWIGTNPFVATSISVVGAPVTVFTGQTFQATRSIQNGGAVPAPAGYAIYLSTDTVIDATDTLVFSGVTAAIAAGATDTATDTCTVPVSTTPGTYYVGLYLSATATASTTNADVTVMLPFVPVAQALAVQNAPITIYAAGGTFDVSRQIDNTGGSAGTAAYEIYLSADATYDGADIQVFTGTTASITPGASDIQTDTCTVAAATAPGTYYVILYIPLTPSELATASTDVTVSDFGPVATSVEPLNTPVRVRAGGTFDVTRTIGNTGTMAGVATYALYLSTDTTITTADILLFTGTTASIAPAGSDVNSVNVTVPTSAAFDTDYYVGLYITASDTAASTETVHILPNTARFSAVSVTEGATAATAGDPFSIQVVVDNTGGVSGTVDYTVYLSTDATIDAGDRSLLQNQATIAADGSDSSAVAVTLPADLPTAIFYVGIYITSASVQTQTAASGPILVNAAPAPREDDGGSCGGGTGGGSLFAFLPLALLAAVCVGLRRRKLAPEN